jgi:hypothetical protein
MKKCTKCGLDKELTEFHWASIPKNKKRSACISCTKTYDALAYKAGIKKGNSAESKKAISDRNYSYVYDILENSTCMDCGCSDIRVLEFDHRPESKKKYGIASMVTSYSLKTIKEEISKCDIVCANCHRIRTYSRLNKCERIKRYMSPL